MKSLKYTNLGSLANEESWCLHNCYPIGDPTNLVPACKETSDSSKKFCHCTGTDGTE